MGKEDPSFQSIVLRRGETKTVPYTYGPRNPALPRHNLTGKTVVMRIKPKSGSEITLTAPDIAITNATGGVITRAIRSSVIDSWTFQNAQYAVMLDGQRLWYGELTIRGLYE